MSDDEMPRLCTDCLGPNPQVRMTKAPNDKACPICKRGYTTYRWRPDPRGAVKSTVLCLTCSKLKDACQCCMLDMKYGLPIHVRDKYDPVNTHLSVASNASTRLNAVLDLERREAAAKALEGIKKGNTLMLEGAKGQDPSVEEGDDEETKQDDGRKEIDPATLAMLRAVHAKPTRNVTKRSVCTFFEKGQCTRGELCPFLHRSDNADRPRHQPSPAEAKSGHSSHNNIQSRYFGLEDE
eukprot:PhM_4_TR17081/c0_g1_i2/m.58500/K12872/RBM22, SLT11; pre-mRNA-splicing factor RBM22/SLT11